MYIVYSSTRSLEFIQRAQLSRFPRAEGRLMDTVTRFVHWALLGQKLFWTTAHLTEPRKWIFIEYVDNFRAVLARLGSEPES
jgi:FAD synthase